MEFLGKTISDTKWTDFSVAFLRAQPNTEVDENEDPIYTDLEWIEKRILDYGRREYRHGKMLMANDAAVIDDNILG